MPDYSAHMHDSARRQVAAWLMLCCAMIFAMVVLGGVTRLTGSGLSMVEWDPILGVVPPLNEQQWEEVFAKYRASPEYQKVNIGMDLHGFKSIYWFEFAHRLLGRSIGLTFLLPLLYFGLRGMLGRPLLVPLIGKEANAVIASAIRAPCSLAIMNRFATHGMNRVMVTIETRIWCRCMNGIIRSAAVTAT